MVPSCVITGVLLCSGLETWASGLAAFLVRLPGPGERGEGVQVLLENGSFVEFLICHFHAEVGCEKLSQLLDLVLHRLLVDVHGDDLVAFWLHGLGG